MKQVYVREGIDRIDKIYTVDGEGEDDEEEGRRGGDPCATMI